MKIKAMMRYHFLSTRMARTKRTVTSLSEDPERLEPFYVAGKNGQWWHCFEKRGLAALQKAKFAMLYSSSTFRYVPRVLNASTKSLVYDCL
jgi:hypothetical protein